MNRRGAENAEGAFSERLSALSAAPRSNFKYLWGPQNSRFWRTGQNLMPPATELYPFVLSTTKGLHFTYTRWGYGLENPEAASAGRREEDGKSGRYPPAVFSMAISGPGSPPVGAVLAEPRGFVLACTPLPQSARLARNWRSPAVRDPSSTKMAMTGSAAGRRRWSLRPPQSQGGTV